MTGTLAVLKEEASKSLVRRFVDDLGAPSAYRDRQYEGSELDFLRDLTASTTLYVGNLSFYTTEEQVHALFSKCGRIKRIIMGLDRFNKTPCGFCFVEYFDRTDALACKKYLDGLKLDERYIRVDLDSGFREGRQYGRGRRGGQVRDEFRAGYDPGRGGWGGSADGEGDRPRRSGGPDDYASSPQSRRQSGPSEHFSKRMRESTGSRNPRFREEDADDS